MVEKSQNHGKLRLLTNNAVKKLLKCFGLVVSRYDKDFPTLWSKSPEFIEIYEQVKSHALTTADRCFMLYQLSKAARSCRGDIAEVGTFLGGTAHLLAKTCPAKQVHIFDTFEGMPQTSPGIDKHLTGDFASTSLEKVKANLADCDNVTFYKGFFPETAGPVEDMRFSFVHIDVDIYRSVKDSLAFFYPRMDTGAIIVLDDYEMPWCPGVKKAIVEFFSDKPESIIIAAKHQCAIIRAVSR